MVLKEMLRISYFLMSAVQLITVVRATGRWLRELPAIGIARRQPSRPNGLWTAIFIGLIFSVQSPASND
jgi:hypothetical protein